MIWVYQLLKHFICAKYIVLKYCEIEFYFRMILISYKYIVNILAFVVAVVS